MEGDSFEGNAAAFPVPGGGLISRLWVGKSVGKKSFAFPVVFDKYRFLILLTLFL